MISNKTLLPVFSLGLKIAAIVMLLAQWLNNFGLARAYTFTWFFTAFLVQQALSALFYCAALWGLARICDGLKRRATASAALVAGLPWIGVCLILAALPMFVSAVGNAGSEQLRFILMPKPVILITIGLSFLLVARHARRLDTTLGQFV